MAQVIRPITFLRDHLRSHYGAEEGEGRWHKYKERVRRAVEMAMLAVHAEFDWGKWRQDGFVMIALDVVADVDQNAYVLDLNR